MGDEPARTFVVERSTQFAKDLCKGLELSLPSTAATRGGGMGSVLVFSEGARVRAPCDTVVASLGQGFALKMFNDTWRNAAELTLKERRRLLSLEYGAQAAAGSAGVPVPDVYALGSYTDRALHIEGEPAFLMQAITGYQTLHDWMLADGHLLGSLTTSLLCAEDVAEFGLALIEDLELMWSDELHEGVVHGDLSANNVMLRMDSRDSGDDARPLTSLIARLRPGTASWRPPILLIDLGTAKIGARTATQLMGGTAPFSSCEIDFPDGSEPSPRHGLFSSKRNRPTVDFWSIGALLLYLRTGAYPPGPIEGCYGCPSVSARWDDALMRRIVDGSYRFRAGDERKLKGLVFEHAAEGFDTPADRHLREAIDLCTRFDPSERDLHAIVRALRAATGREAETEAEDKGPSGRDTAPAGSLRSGQPRQAIDMPIRRGEPVTPAPTMVMQAVAPETAPQPELEIIPQSEHGLVTQSESKSAPQSEHDFASQPEHELAQQPEPEVVPQPEPETVTLTKSEAPPESVPDVAPQPAPKEAVKPAAEIAPQPTSEVAPIPAPDVTSRPVPKVALQPKPASASALAAGTVVAQAYKRYRDDGEPRTRYSADLLAIGAGEEACAPEALAGIAGGDTLRAAGDPVYLSDPNWECEFKSDHTLNLPWQEVEVAVITSAIAPHDMSDWFHGCSRLLEVLGTGAIDTRAVKGMESLFWGCSSLTELDLSSFDTSAVTTMFGMFCGCSSLTELDLSGFRTRAVTDMSWMFCDCPSLTELDLSGFRTGAVTDMSGMFWGCSSLTELDLSGFRTGAVTGMSCMFRDCSSLTELDLSGFRTDALEEVAAMFSGCSLLVARLTQSFGLRRKASAPDAGSSPEPEPSVKQEPSNTVSVAAPKGQLPYLAPSEPSRDNPNMLFMLGLSLYDDRGTHQGYAKAAHLFLAAAELGHAEAQYRLGTMYAEGKGVSQDPSEAARWYRAAAEQGHARAQRNLSDILRRGVGVKRDNVEAARRYREAAKRGDTDARYSLGFMLERGLGVKQDHAEAARWYRTAAKRGNMKAQRSLAAMLEQGRGVKQNLSEAARWYRAAAEQGNQSAQYRLGLLLEQGKGVEQDSAEAARWYRAAAERGHAAAQLKLGLMLDNGEGITQSPSEAAFWYLKAAGQGNALAQYNLAVCYTNGKGVARNDAKAASWYRAAAEQGLAEAQCELGVCYANGRGVKRSLERAIGWYRLAAEQGNAAAQRNLGSCYIDGAGFSQNPDEAIAWYRAAAEQGDAEAQYRLGLCYDKGRYVEQNLSEAERWYRAAAERGHKDAKRELRRPVFFFRLF